MSSWLGGSKQIAVGRVVRYRTHERHEQDGYCFAKGAFCFATRTPAGELGLFFFQGGLEHGDSARALWLPAEYGLCGVEPGVLDPELRNMAMVNQIVQQSDARVLGEIREEVARGRSARGEREDSILDAMRGEMAKDLDAQIANDLRAGEKEVVLESGRSVKASWKVVEARVLTGKKAKKKARRKKT